MSRTSRSVPAVALLAVLAGITLTGCSDTRTGAAAVVDGDRVEVSTLNARVDRASDARAQSGSQAMSGVKETKLQLSAIIYDRVVAEASRRAGVTASATEIADWKRAHEGPGKPPLTVVAAASGIAPEDLDTVVADTILRDKLVSAAGADPDTQAGEAVGEKIIADTAQSMKITVNPRYGTWDTVAGGIAPTTYDWLVPDRLEQRA